MALDFLPERLSLLQLRSLYDAVWGFEQDSSGFKRWAIDRTGALRAFLDPIDVDEVDESLFESLGQRMSASAARAPRQQRRAVSTRPRRARHRPARGCSPPRRRAPGCTAAGAEPKWFRKSAKWRQGPTWIEHVYPPRPDWTRWETR